MDKRGIRNNNPGNIKRGEPWFGLRRTQTDPDFCQFTSDLWGIRAMIIIIRTYVCKYNLHTIEAIISKWAPSNENNTTLYVNFVRRYMIAAGSNYFQQLSKVDFYAEYYDGAFHYTEGFYRLYWMMKAMCIMESDYDLDFDLFRNAYDRTLSQPQHQGLNK